MPTEMKIEQNSDKLTIWQPQRRQSEILGWLVEQLTILAEALGEAMTPARLKIYAADLADIGQAQLAVSLQRARRECRFFPKIAELRDLAGASPKQERDAEMRKAWEALTAFVRKYVSNDAHGSYGPQYGWYSKSYPKLNDRIQATVRRTGGWKVYACMDDKDFPFVQKRFFEEYEACPAVEQIAPGRVLATVDAEMRFKLLVANKTL